MKSSRNLGTKFYNATIQPEDPVRRTSLRTANCPVARALDVIDGLWSPRIVRHASRGLRRVSQFRTSDPQCFGTARTDPSGQCHPQPPLSDILNQGTVL